MNDINNFDNGMQNSQNEQSSPNTNPVLPVRQEQTGQPVPPAKPPRKHGARTTAKVAGILAGVIIIGGGAGFGGAYFANKSQNTAIVGGREPNSTPNANVNSNSVGGNGNTHNSSAPTLDELQSNISSPQHTASSGTEYNTDGTYMYMRDLVSAVRDSVVYIETYVESRGQKVGVAAGSGIIISSDGYIITNNHLVEDSSSYTVKVFTTNPETEESTSETYDAVLCGTDADTDLAVLKINAEDLPAAKLGDSDKLRLGDDVIAIGNPLRYETSVTKGIVSGLHRQVSSSGRSLTAIQTDTPVNSGNSGGALFNTYGEVVGVVNEKRIDYYAESIGFAITINEAKNVINDLISKGYVTGRAILGITYLQISETAALYRGDTAGWQVSSIDAYAPIATSGLLVGDTIVEIDGVSVFDINTDNLFADKKPGDKVTVTVVRTGPLGRNTTVDIEIELSEYKGD